MQHLPNHAREDERTVEPHPLDYDWRFTSETVSRLAALIDPAGACIAVGTPSVARYLDSVGRPVLLIDRQPVQGVVVHQRLDPSYDPPVDGAFNTAVTDPPWYPEVFHRWLGWVARTIQPRGRILCSLWPLSTRPDAQREREELLSWVHTWASTDLVVDALGYQMPAFEAYSHQQSSHATQEVPRRGDLLIIQKHETPELPSELPHHEMWHRFVFGEYQLALRLRGEATDAPTIRKHPLADGWIWPSVSRRAPGRGQIDLWSSRNEVAIVSGSTSLLRMLHELCRQPVSSVAASLRRDPRLSGLLDWHIASLSTEGALEWTHHA